MQSRLRLTTFRQLLAAAMATRLAVDTSTQIFNPFLAIIAAGIGVDVVTLGRLVSLRSAMGLVSPLFGSLADRYGYRRIMRIGLLLLAVGMFLIGGSRARLALVSGMVLSGLGLSGFVPTLQAYVSARLPYHQRARGIGVLEYSWALAGLVGLLLVGFLIDRSGWRAPFFVLGTTLLTGWVLFGFLPSARGPHAASLPGDEARVSWRRLQAFFDLGVHNRSAYAVIFAAAFFFFAQVHILIAHGVWLETEYGLGAAALGTIAFVQGGADLCGSVLVSLITDRVGKKRAVLAGMAGALLVYVALPFANVGLVPAVTALVLTRFTFEYAIVSNLSLVSEQAPQQRGKVMTLSAAVNLLGATLTGFTGPWAYTHFGVWGLGPVSAASTAVAMAVLVLWGREGA